MNFLDFLFLNLCDSHRVDTCTKLLHQFTTFTRLELLVSRKNSHLTNSSVFGMSKSCKNFLFAAEHGGKHRNANPNVELN